MKNLKKLLGLMAVSTLALVGMANVHATASVPEYKYEDCTAKDNTCLAKIGTHYYALFDAALLDAVANGNATIELLNDVVTANQGSSLANGVKITKSVTIDLGSHNIDLGANIFDVSNNATLKLKGTGEVETTGNNLVTVADGSSFVTEGGLLLTAGTHIAETAGTVNIGAGAETSFGGTAASLVEVTAHTAKVTINATYGASGNEVAAPIVDFSSVTAAPARNAKGASVTIAGGNYYTETSPMFTIANGVEVTISGGNLTSTGSITSGAIAVSEGKLTVSGGTITSGGNAIRVSNSNGKVVTVLVNGATVSSKNGAALLTAGTATGSVTIEKGTLKSEGSYSPLYFANGKLTYKINGGTVEGAKDVPAIYIEDSLLTGMAEGGASDVFKGMITNGKFLNMIIGDAQKSEGAPDDYTAAQVVKYILATGKEEKTEGSYKVVGTGSGDTQEPGQAGPGDDEPSKSPATFDAIGGLVTMAISSLGVVGTATKKLFR